MVTACPQEGSCNASLSSEEVGSIGKHVPTALIVTLFSLLIVLSTVTLLLLIIVASKKGTTKKVTGMLFISVGVAKLLMVFTSGTIIIVDSLREGFLSGFDCHFFTLFELLFIVSTILGKLAVWADRYCTIFDYDGIIRPMTPTVCVGVIASQWTISLLYSLRTLPELRLSKRRLLPVHQCMLFFHAFKNGFLFRGIDFACLYLLPLMIMCYFYAKILPKLISNRRNLSTTLVDIQGPNRALVIPYLTGNLILFGLAWAPFYLLEFYNSLVETSVDNNERHDVKKTLQYLRFTFVLWCLIANCLIPPVLYFWCFPRKMSSTISLFARSKVNANYRREIVVECQKVHPLSIHETNKEDVTVPVRENPTIVKKSRKISFLDDHE